MASTGHERFLDIIGWGMKDQLKYIICQKIKWQRPVNWEDQVDHHLYSVAPLSELSINILGPFQEDEYDMRYIILIVGRSKFVDL